MLKSNDYSLGDELDEQDLSIAGLPVPTDLTKLLSYPSRRPTSWDSNHPHRCWDVLTT